MHNLHCKSKHMLLIRLSSADGTIYEQTKVISRYIRTYIYIYFFFFIQFKKKQKKYI